MYSRAKCGLKKQACDGSCASYQHFQKLFEHLDYELTFDEFLRATILAQSYFECWTMFCRFVSRIMDVELQIEQPGPVTFERFRCYAATDKYPFKKNRPIVVKPWNIWIMLDQCRVRNVLSSLQIKLCDYIYINKFDIPHVRYIEYDIGPEFQLQCAVEFPRLQAENQLFGAQLITIADSFPTRFPPCNNCIMSSHPMQKSFLYQIIDHHKKCLASPPEVDPLDLDHIEKLVKISKLCSRLPEKGIEDKYHSYSSEPLHHIADVREIGIQVEHPIIVRDQDTQTQKVEITQITESPFQDPMHIMVTRRLLRELPFFQPRKRPRYKRIAQKQARFISKLLREISVLRQEGGGR